MKRTIALLAALITLLACLPAGALAERYTFHTLNDTVYKSPDNLHVLFEYQDGDSVVIYLEMEPARNVQIVTTMYDWESYRGKSTRTLGKEEFEHCLEEIRALYPSRSKSMIIRPEFGGNERIYRYYGQSKQTGEWILVYSGVLDGLYVSTVSFAGQYGFKRDQLHATFDAFNSLFEVFARSKELPFEMYDPADFDVENNFLLYDDNPESIFQTY